MSKRFVYLFVGFAFLAGLFTANLLNPYVFAQDAKGPKWQHAHELRVRKAGEADFTKDTKKYGIEVFRDENNGNLIYISETGSITVVPGK